MLKVQKFVASDYSTLDSKIRCDFLFLFDLLEYVPTATTNTSTNSRDILYYVKDLKIFVECSDIVNGRMIGYYKVFSKN